MKIERIKNLVIICLGFAVYILVLKALSYNRIDYDDLTYSDLKSHKSSIELRLDKLKEDFNCEVDSLSKSID